MGNLILQLYQKLSLQLLIASVGNHAWIKSKATQPPFLSRAIVCLPLPSASAATTYKKVCRLSASLRSVQCPCTHSTSAPNCSWVEPMNWTGLLPAGVCHWGVTLLLMYGSMSQNWRRCELLYCVFPHWQKPKAIFGLLFGDLDIHTHLAIMHP